MQYTGWARTVPPATMAGASPTTMLAPAAASTPSTGPSTAASCVRAAVAPSADCAASACCSRRRPAGTPGAAQHCSPPCLLSDAHLARASSALLAPCMLLPL